MPPETLTAERILETTEEVLRRYGPAKATVVDVARALGVSHGSVYRHFRTKAALREAVTQRWLDQAHAELSAIAEDGGRPAQARLRTWLEALFAAKRRKAGGDPELFATYLALTEEHSTVVAGHVAVMVGLLTRIIRDGVAGGEFAAGDPGAAAQAVWDATVRFHDPAYAAEWFSPGVDAAYSAVNDLILRGLRA
ncbi:MULTISPECIES: TetR family transcriptional regulator [unclassified Streptomyces]|uniref:TetR family transcriptional regulator n=1 Tax=unclassified Streptomyces TaxID=2593676 RepID=UPI0003A922E8|nr:MULTISPECIES: TetR family transcriptional regulator [unclassified Streptomyces]MYX32098.1 TetR family transcriptional regulator [Streptomyces sp. SID8377]